MKSIKLWGIAIMAILISCYSTVAIAAVEGQCANCHTMHNSQDGGHMILNTTIDGTAGGTHGGGYASLTRGSCVGCHEGTNIGGNRPFVIDMSGPTYGMDTLAGGNFFWGIADGAKSHNVKGIPNMLADTELDEAPGRVGGCANSCHDSLFDVDEATGCEGCHLEPAHHAPQQVQTAVAGEANGYFRFLSGHHSGDGHGVEGIEDVDWQYTAAAGDHNEYLGYEGTHNAGNGGMSTLGNTMTGYCTGCHGNFHLQNDGDANWIRHPSDAVIPTGGEYADINSEYNPNVPVARPNLTGIADTAAVVVGTDMVMCLSCHRAHGSPYDDMLRWDYQVMDAGNGDADTGCFVCHTAKD